MQAESPKMLHQLSAEEAAQALHTDAACGLERSQAHARLKKSGLNTLFFVRKKSVFSCVSEYLTDPSVLLCILLSIVAVCFSRVKTGLTVFGILAVSIAVGSFFSVQITRKRERTARYSVPLARVIRGGKPVLTAAWNLVPGDVILLRAGDVVPADARLIRADGLMVASVSYSDGRLIKNPATAKTAEPLPPGAFDTVPFRANMVYGRSEIVSGTARAIVTATGSHAYVAAAGYAQNLSDTDCPAAVQLLQKKSRYYSIFLLLAVIPLTVIGMLASPTSDFLDLFLLALSLSVASLSGAMAVFAGLIASQAAEQAELPLAPEDSAVFCHIHRADTIREIRDIVLVGNSCLHDGKEHTVALYTGEHVCTSEDLKGETADPILTAISRFVDGYYGNVAGNEEDPFLPYADGLRDLFRAANLDCDAVRASAGYPEFCTEEDTSSFGCVTVRTAEMSHSYRLTFSDSMLSQCTQIRIGSYLVPASAYSVSAAKSSARVFEKRACRVMYVFTEENNQTVFEGFVAFAPLTVQKNGAGHTVSDVLEHFGKGNIRVTLFLHDDPRDVYFATLAGFSEGDDTPGRLVLCDNPSEEAMAFLRARQKIGKKVCACSVEQDAAQVLRAADVAVSMDTLRYDSEEIESAYFDSLCSEGERNSARCSQQMRGTADVLIRRCSHKGGGLFGILTAYRTAVSVTRRTSVMLNLLTDTQILRAVLVVSSLVTGLHIVSVPLVLFSGMIFDLFGVMLLIHSKPTGIPAVAVSRVDLTFTVSLLTGIALFFVSMIPTWTGWVAGISGQGCYLFLSLLLVQITSFLRRYREDCGSFRLNAVTGGFLLFFASAIVRCVTWAPVASFLEIGKMNLIRCAFLPVGPVLYLLLYTFVPRLTRRMFRQM